MKILSNSCFYGMNLREGFFEQTFKTSILHFSEDLVEHYHFVSYDI